jgi:hypothetical protein
MIMKNKSNEFPVVDFEPELNKARFLLIIGVIFAMVSVCSMLFSLMLIVINFIK